MTTATLGKLIWGLGLIAWFVIRYPYARRARRVSTLRRDVSLLDQVLLVAAFLGLLVVPLSWVIIRWPRAADFPASPVAVALGAIVFVMSLWLFRRSHKDLGRQWSIDLKIREHHEVVRQGVYSRIRHPMYASFWLWGLAQALLLPNMVAGCSGLVAVAIFFFARVGHEERMMVEALGDDYRSYMASTKRIVPGLY